MAESVEIANAYVALTTKMPGAKKDIEQALGGSVGESAGKSLGRSLVKGVGGVAIGGLAAVAGAGLATLGVALTKGFGRLQALDQATAKLEGLGHSAESVELIMGNALSSVKGTAFGLDEAAGTAATAVAAGVKPGADLARYLGIIADTSTIAGVGLEEVGRVMNNVTTLGAAYNDSLQILAQKGLPVYTWLAEEAGVSEAAIKEMASQGEISSAQLAAALEKNVGGAALKSGETFAGSLANMNASLGRIGAGLLGGVFGELAPTFQAATQAMAPLEAVAGELGEKLGQFLAPAFELIQSVLAGGFDFSPFLELLGYLSPLGLAFKVLEPVLPLIVDALAQIATVIGGALGQVLAALLPVLGEVVVMLADLAAQIIPMLLPIVTVLAEVIGSVLLALTPLFPLLGDLIEAILPILTTALAYIAEVFQGVANAIGSVLIPIVETLVEVLGGVITFLTGVFTGDWDKAWQGVVQIFEGLFTGIWEIGKGVINGLIDLINGFTGGLNEVGHFLSDITGGGINFEIGKIPHLAEGGVVSKSRGGTLAVVGEGRYDEAVIPLSPGVLAAIGGGGGRGGDIIIQPQPGMSEEAIGRAAAREKALQDAGVW